MPLKRGIRHAARRIKRKILVKSTKAGQKAKVKTKMAYRSVKEGAKKTTSKASSYLKRNKRRIGSAVIIGGAFGATAGASYSAGRRKGKSMRGRPRRR